MSKQDIEIEQRYVATLYRRLDEMRERTAERLAQVQRDFTGTPQALSERDAEVARHSGRLAQLRTVETNLCFGRLDLDEDEQRYIGRLGIFDEDWDYSPMLIDWRAPAAQPFYVATPAHREGVRRRRHIRTSIRTVVDIQDEQLEGGGADDVGGVMLLAALSAPRSGQMRDIVSTIQAEQDRIIRSGHRGMLVVEGGPGTGKTAVCLHRAAYLLYTHRDQLATRGVLVIGPNQTFLRYIDQVLPSLGETGVRLSTIADLIPGLSARAHDDPHTTEVKGRPELAEVMVEAVRDRQEIPAEPLEITLSDMHAGLGYQPDTVILQPAVCERARDRARATKRPHNQARKVFVTEVAEALARQLVDRLGEDPFAGEALGGGDAPGEGVNLLTEADVTVLAADLRRDPHLLAALEQLWPVLTPQRLLIDLFAAPERLDAAARALPQADRRALVRANHRGWSPADVPLLDEAAELIDDEDSAQERVNARALREEQEYARGVLDVFSGSRSLEAEDENDLDLEMPTVTGLISARGLARRQEESDNRTVAERAAADRRWMYGHVIVDEAQELSPMAWRALMRRCPSRWMTVVGDLDQTSAPGGVDSWEEVLGDYAGERLRREQLTVNYRTTAEIMELAWRVRPRAGEGTAPRSVRSGEPPVLHQVSAADLVAQVAGVVEQEEGKVGDGLVAVIAPEQLLSALRTIVADSTAPGEAAEPIAPVGVLSAREAKGLEFDSVVVVEPALIEAESARGRSDLYVALTRATNRLSIVHTGEFPPLQPAR